jgi:Protein of unknown function (DUF3106)
MSLHACSPSKVCARSAWLGLLVTLLSLGAWAQSPGPLTQQSAATVKKSDAKSSGWSRLSSAEQQALAPLSASWPGMNPAQQRKWLEVSRNFSSLPQTEQAKMQQRMREWAALSPQERAQARLNFGKTAEVARELSPAEKLAKWQAYQALPPEQRQKLAEQAKTKPQGAAPAVQPVPAQKLAVVPALNTARATKPAEIQGESAEATEGSSSQ